MDAVKRGQSTQCLACANLGFVRHGHCSEGKMTPLYQIWANLHYRCNNPKSAAWKNYGGRGITVSEDWQSFERFLADMGPRPSPDHSVDRIDVDGPYSRDNCRWATPEEQNNNRRDNRMLTFQGRTQTAIRWARELGMPPNVLFGRLKTGWSIERALSVPTHGTHGIYRITANGETLSVSKWAMRLDCPEATIYQRIKRGWTPAEAVLTSPSAPRAGRHTVRVHDSESSPDHQVEVADSP